MQTVAILYNSPQLEGSFLLSPLKSYQSYFDEKSSDHSICEKCLWRITQVVLGIFAYPIFGLLAALGILFNFIDSFFIQKENSDRTEALLTMTKAGIKNCKSFSCQDNPNCSGLVREGFESSTIQEFSITKASNLDEQLKAVTDAINEQSSKCNRVWIERSGKIADDGTGHITLKLKTAVPIASNFPRNIDDDF